ncbi:MAG: hypothetical protein NZM13_08820 [Cyclobacteriaceae bacterium]|nr:hypothetical protein [Cyclobacteriaceae bacterium]MDW8330583.1 inositol monophosphatase family protein [Cyclobacteriaceae bacterium]
MNHALIKNLLLDAGKAIRQHLIHSLSAQSVHDLSLIREQKQEDTIFAIDREVEPVLLQIFHEYQEAVGGIVLIAEGVGDESGHVVLPQNIPIHQAQVRIIVDPIDGTRGLMYNKRPAFFLAGAAPNKGQATGLSDIEVAVMVELPVSKQYLADTLWAIKGKGVQGVRDNILTGTSEQIFVAPSKATSILGGFSQFARFFPPGREILSAIEEEFIRAVTPKSAEKALVFEDQYISSGGQLYELLMGHDRFVADIRGLLYQKLRKEGKAGGHVCHPYDVCAHLIGCEAGLVITDEYGNELNAPLNLTHEINWIGYANSQLCSHLKPELLSLLKKHQLIEP